MVDKISVTCSGCGKTCEVPEYNESGLPYEWVICSECREETELNPRKLNSKAWEWAWMELIRTMRKEFGDAVADRLVKYSIDKRNFHIKDRKRIHEDALEPQNLKEENK